MLPCYSLFLEVEIPDPDLNYFIVGQHELDNTEKLLAPPPFGVPTRDIGVEVEPYNLEIEDTETTRTYSFSSSDTPLIQVIATCLNDTSQNFNSQTDVPIGADPIVFTYNKGTGRNETISFSVWTGGALSPTESNFEDAFTWNCESGLNTFVLNASCLDGPIDLLEGWGAAKPNYKWVDVITDTTDIELQRGFDMKQGIVGTPIAGVMEANILDPYLEGIETSRIAVGQRVRLRAGTEIVFSGVASSVRSEYDAVNTPTLRIEAVDALGLLNAQMVDVRPQEGYNTRIAEAASKVELPLIQQDSTTILNPTEDPMSALELLVETQDSEGSVVWLDRFGTMYSTNRYWLDMTDLPVLRNSRFGDVPRFTFTNNPGNPEYEAGIGALTQDVCLSQYKQVADTSQVINGITFYNYVEEDDTDFEGLPIKTIVRDTYTFESANSRRLYGDAGVKLTTYLNPTDLVGYADYVFANYDTPKTKVETIQFPLDKWKSLDVPEMVSIDIGDPVKVRIDDPLTSHTLNRATQRVAQIRHRITPQEWLCELDLL